MLQQALISIHAPREGSDCPDLALAAAALAFQSTLPVRGATDKAYACSSAMPFQSTLPVRGATPPGPYQNKEAYTISIHAPREGSDADADNESNNAGQISIHAPREGSDAVRSSPLAHPLNFNPRSP